MKQFWITFFGSVVGVVVGAVLAGIAFFVLIAALIGGALSSAASETALPQDGIVLELDLRTPRLDTPSRSPFGFAEPLPVVDIVRTLERAEADRRVRGLFIRANEFGLSPGMAEEI
ncbi:MAG: signal peptide peptidase SppA, partial [Alphaproteobacteria bacterium]|nr:signal peptide peptidase SppA [Alphaproteobacteria bacterium]